MAGLRQNYGTFSNLPKILFCHHNCHQHASQWKPSYFLGINVVFKYLKIPNVRYHCGGWPEEVNSCVLNSYMVYLLPKQSLGYQQHSYTVIVIMHIYNWYHSITTSIPLYTPARTWFIYMAHSPCFFFPLLIPFFSPFYPSLLTWNPPCCDRICPPCSQVARKLTSPFSKSESERGSGPKISTLRTLAREKLDFLF